MKFSAESLILRSGFCSLIIIIAQKCDYFLLVRGQKVPAVFVFGDSFGDTGNNEFFGSIATSDFPPYGRDFKHHIPTEGLGIKELLPPYLDPNLKAQDLLTGVCFASAGSGLDNLTFQVLNVIPFGKQIEYFKEYRKTITGLVGEEETTTIIREAIFFITIGSNDIGYYFLVSPRRLQFNVQEYTDFLLNTYTVYIKFPIIFAPNSYIWVLILQELYNLGATRIALINLPPLGCLPIERTLTSLKNKGACDVERDEAASGFNSGLNAMIDGLKPVFPTLKIASLDYNNLISELITNPSKYGLEVIARGCCGTGTIEVLLFTCNQLSPFTCPDASKYLFFDAVHLTQKAYQIISNVFLTRYVAQHL
ncbi:GDSL esterase/lipase At2g42990-like [Cryptomeria japonica]|uniref:GDSL esterase/lipase At2g42990-like n=1 Tax=Cryptomeria japonica TaxID=3369 RepID=UPI0027DA5CBA|nr:GDSL esterase/lipase At2g42990-like [Cryptomeria japonica]